MPKKEKNLVEIAKKKRQLRIVEKLQKDEPLTKQEIAELEEFEKPPLPSTVVRTAREVSKVMDVTLRTVQRWKDEGMPTTAEGYYDLEEIKVWYEKTRKHKKSEGREFWEERIKKHQASLLELKLKKETEELVAKEEVERIQVAQVMALKRSLLAIPRRLAPILAGTNDPRECEAILEEDIGEIIDEFAGVRKKGEELEDAEGGKARLDREAEASVQAPHENTGERVG